LLVLLGANPANAHRLDEYLQATTIAVEPGRVEAEIRLVPGIDVFPIVFADIDRDADGVASAAEQRAYAERVLGDLSLTVDGKRIPLRIISSTLAPKELLQAGRGEIQVRLEADVPTVARERTLFFENRHQRGFGAYLVNGLMPRNTDVHLTAQRRSYDQSTYELDYTDASAAAPTTAFGSWLQPWGWIDGALLIVIVSLVWLGRRAGRDRPA
jgi:hypothetical protein